MSMQTMSPVTAFPEGAWFRVVAQLDLVSCGCLAAVDSEASRSTSGALMRLHDAHHSATEVWRERMATIEAEQRAALQRAGAQRATAEAAILQLMPLRTGRAAERFGEQLEEIFGELGRVRDERTMEEEQNAADNFRTQEAEAAVQRQAYEESMRGLLVEHLMLTA